MNRRVRLTVALGRPFGASVCIWIVNFHEALRSSKWLEAELRVERMCVASREQHAAESLKDRVSNELIHEAPRQTFTSMLRNNV